MLNNNVSKIKPWDIEVKITCKREIVFLNLTH